MFKLESKVPEYYIEQSRDFQLLCQLVDLIENHIQCGTRASDNLYYIDKTKNTTIESMASVLAFFHTLPIDEKYLRYAYKYFSLAIKYKGTAKVLEELQYLLNKYADTVDCKITNASNDGDEYKVTYYADKKINNNLLMSLMRYLLPAGYNLGIEYATKKTESYQTAIYPKDEIEWLLDSNVLDTARISQLRLDDNSIDSTIETLTDAIDKIEINDLSTINSRVINATDVSSITNRVVGDTDNFPDEVE